MTEEVVISYRVIVTMILAYFGDRLLYYLFGHTDKLKAGKQVIDQTAQFIASGDDIHLSQVLKKLFPEWNGEKLTEDMIQQLQNLDIGLMTRDSAFTLKFEEIMNRLNQFEGALSLLTDVEKATDTIPKTSNHASNHIDELNQ